VASTSALSLGMFWGGLVVAAVPILFTLGVGLYVWRRYYLSQRQSSSPSRDS
jgi:hypothetical protein